MQHEFYCRGRRYFRSNSHEIWSMEFDYGEGYVSEDVIILYWNDKEPEVLCLTISKDRLKSEEYLSIILGLFEDLIEGDKTLQLRRIFD